MQSVQENVELAAMEIYNLQQEVFSQGEYIKDLNAQKAEHEKEIKLNHEQEVVKNQGVLSKEGLIAFSLSTLEAVKNGIMNWRILNGF